MMQRKDKVQDGSKLRYLSPAIMNAGRHM